jgi:peptidyl-tRNA hydrolase, PTH2 family
MKQVIVVNQALRLPKGKLAAQVAHAAVAALLAASEAAVRAWLVEGMPKVVVAAPDEAALVALEAEARERVIPTALIRDAGRTVVAAGTVTCLGLGPGDDATIDELTGGLKLV